MTILPSSTVTDDMVERAWAAIVGADVAGQCFVASLTRGDLRTGLEAASAAQAAPDEMALDLLRWGTFDMTPAARLDWKKRAEDFLSSQPPAHRGTGA